MKHVWMIHFSCPSPNAKHIIVIIIIQVQNWIHLHLLNMKIPNLKD
jgi:hypothetical protein